MKSNLRVKLTCLEQYWLCGLQIQVLYPNAIRKFLDLLAIQRLYQLLCVAHIL